MCFFADIRNAYNGTGNLTIIKFLKQGIPLYGILVILIIDYCTFFLSKTVGYISYLFC